MSLRTPPAIKKKRVEFGRLLRGPTPDPSQEGNTPLCAPTAAPLMGGVGGGWAIFTVDGETFAARFLTAQDLLFPLHEPEGRARHSVRAGAWRWGTDAPYRAGWFMATMRDIEIVEAFPEPEDQSDGKYGLLNRQPLTSNCAGARC